MPEFIKTKLKWKFLLGFFICTAIAGLAGLAGIVSLGQIQSNMKKTTMETLNKQLTQTQQVMPLRSFAISIISASKKEELEEINKKLQQLQRKDTLITGEQQVIEDSIEILLSQKSNQLSTLSNLAGLRKSNTATLNEVINLAINIVDNAEFDSAVKMDDAITEIRGNISTMATSSLIDQQIKKISDTAEKAISTIKSALSVRSLCNELNAMVKETLATIDVASVDYAKIEITTLLGNTKNELAILPRDETTKNISTLLGDFDELVNKMVEAKKQVLFAEDALNEASAKIWEQMRRVDNNMLEAAQNMNLNADRAFKTSKSLFAILLS